MGAVAESVKTGPSCRHSLRKSDRQPSGDADHRCDYPVVVMGATGNDFDLSAFEAAILRDPDVLGVLYTGSLGRGTADRYSDLDIECWVSAQTYAAAATVIPRLMGYLGVVHFVYERHEDASFMTGFVGPDWQRVDLELHRHSDTVQMASNTSARVVKDIDGSLARMLAQAVTEPTTASSIQARAVVAGAIDSQIYLSLHNAHGSVWSCLGATC